MQSEFKQKLKNLTNRIDSALDQWLPLPIEKISGQLNESVRYSAMAGGKRIRPALCLMVAESIIDESDALMRAACAYELIHAYSLIHDDLPAMDNDDYRRGKLTNHKVFGEATAILAGDSLLTMAFEWLSSLNNYGISSEKVVKIISLAAECAGHNGMIAGQMLDLANEKKQIDLETLKNIHSHKTGALIKAPIKTGAILADFGDNDCLLLNEYAENIGLLFQIKDDLLDIEGDASQLGKATGRDAELGKSTFPVLLGIDGTRKYARQILDSAHLMLNKLSMPLPILADMADYIYYREV